MTEEEQRYAEMYCKCKNCGTYELGLQDGLCNQCLQEIFELKE